MLRHLYMIIRVLSFPLRASINPLFQSNISSQYSNRSSHFSIRLSDQFCNFDPLKCLIITSRWCSKFQFETLQSQTKLIYWLICTFQINAHALLTKLYIWSEKIVLLKIMATDKQLATRTIHQVDSVIQNCNDFPNKPPAAYLTLQRSLQDEKGHRCLFQVKKNFSNQQNSLLIITLLKNINKCTQGIRFSKESTTSVSYYPSRKIHRPGKHSKFMVYNV
ncbi:hypothetical protein FGO68_gene16653 [Halteria grandinella]|uniref:Uncharacterized protein n=1 Tax=Halteria grandinella TaxID=5974 RepID=A0A8J8T8S7_HALGN|nr:hypothetical protein FGO68_gene16653 [Halteria grandinella]